MFIRPFLGLQLRQCRCREPSLFLSFNIHICCCQWEWADPLLCAPLCIHAFIKWQKKFLGEEAVKPDSHQLSIPTLPLRLTYTKCMINSSGSSCGPTSGEEIWTRAQHEVRRGQDQETRGRRGVQNWGIPYCCSCWNPTGLSYLGAMGSACVK